MGYTMQLPTNERYVLGEKELENGSISLRERGKPEQKALKPVELSQILGGYQGEKPYEPVNWPLLLSKQLHQCQYATAISCMRQLKLTQVSIKCRVV